MQDGRAATLVLPVITTAASNGVPVCQCSPPMPPLIRAVVNTMHDALSSVVDTYLRAVKRERQTTDTLEQAHCQQLERLRYQQHSRFNQVGQIMIKQRTGTALRNCLT